jgi:hypothetical protein
MAYSRSILLTYANLIEIVGAARSLKIGRTQWRILAYLLRHASLSKTYVYATLIVPRAEVEVNDVGDIKDQ